MIKNELSRRNFIGKAAAGIAGAAIYTGTTQSAASYSRIIGANDRVNIGFRLWRPKHRSPENG